MTTDARNRGTERKQAQGHIRATNFPSTPANVHKRCRDCRYIAIVFRPMCSLGDFATTKNATCSKWTAKR